MGIYSHGIRAIPIPIQGDSHSFPFPFPIVLSIVNGNGNPIPMIISTLYNDFVKDQTLNAIHLRSIL